MQAKLLPVLALALASLAGCTTSPRVASDGDGVTRVFAEVRGITWMSCAATLEVALRQRLEGVANISISETNQTTEVTFRPGADAFSARAFREAHQQAKVQIITMRLDACGLVESGGREPRLRAGATALLLAGDHGAVAGSRICVSGTLREEAEGLRLAVTTSTPAPSPER